MTIHIFYVQKLISVFQRKRLYGTQFPFHCPRHPNIDVYSIIKVNKSKKYFYRFEKTVDVLKNALNKCIAAISASTSTADVLLAVSQSKNVLFIIRSDCHPAGKHDFCKEWITFSCKRCESVLEKQCYQNELEIECRLLLDGQHEGRLFTLSACCIEISFSIDLLRVVTKGSGSVLRDFQS